MQETGIKTIPKKKKYTKPKLSAGALQIAEKRRDAKGKEEKERYTHLNAVSKNSKDVNVWQNQYSIVK